MKRPIEVTPICLMLIVAAAVGLFTYGPERGWVIEYSAIISFGIVLLVTIGFWCGDRLCHRLLAFFAVWAMIRPVMLVLIEPPTFDRVVMLVEAGLALPLLIWLFTPKIDAFTRVPEVTDLEPGTADDHQAG